MAEQQLHRRNMPRWAASIVVLLCSCSPSAVRWTVAVDKEFIVSTIERMELRRSSSHVGEEVLELRPPFTNCEPAPSVISPSGISLIPASCEHLGPGLVLHRELASGALTVDGHANSVCFSKISSKAPARLRLACAQHTARDHALLAADTAAEPPKFSLNVPASADYRPSLKDLTCKIVWCRHQRSIHLITNESRAQNG